MTKINENSGPEISLASIANDLEKNSESLRRFEHEDAINDDTKIPGIIPVVMIRNSIYAVKGDISIIGGLPKVGKTAITAYMLATALMKDVPEGFDSLGIRSSFCQGKHCIYIDTEQPKAYTDKLRKNIMNILGVSRQPSNLGILNLRKYDSATKLKKVLDLMNKYPDAHLWIVDGLADLIKDPNDTKESFGVIEMFMMKSDQLDTAIILAIHENPGNTGKLRGNLGSEAERKCGGAISVKKIKDRKVHSIEAKVIRGSEDFEPVYFHYDKALGRMVSLDEAQSADIKKSVDKDQIKFQKRVTLARRCLIPESAKYGDLVQRILLNVREVEGKMIKERTAQLRIEELVSSQIISMQGELYVITDKYIPQP